MKKIMMISSCLLIWAFGRSQPVLESAKIMAAEKHQLILLNFSGSDWCIPCIKMRKEIFDNKEFKQLSDSLLIMINADFPRSKKNKKDIATSLQNETLADKYNPDGVFPYTLLLDADGRVLKTWEGLPEGDAESFGREIKAFSRNFK